MRRVMLIWALCVLGVLALGAEKNKTREVSVEGLAFKPDKITVKVGQAVTWTNNDDRDHTVECKEADLKSGIIHRGETFSFTFKKAGTFHYKCRLHPRMKGQVVVEK